jgi:hypothetical protein
VIDIEHAARRQVLQRLMGIVLLVVVMASVINLVFLRIVAKPLEKFVETVRQIARGQFGVQAGPFRTAELEYLAREINSMSSSLAEIDRHRRHEMDKARRIQEHLLPHDIRIPGLDVANFYQPATEVAGDYYDVVPAPDGSWPVYRGRDRTWRAGADAAMLNPFTSRRRTLRRSRTNPAVYQRPVRGRVFVGTASMMLARGAGGRDAAICQPGHGPLVPAQVGGARELAVHGMALGNPSELDLGDGVHSARLRGSPPLSH